MFSRLCTCACMSNRVPQHRDSIPNCYCTEKLVQCEHAKKFFKILDSNIPGSSAVVYEGPGLGTRAERDAGDESLECDPSGMK